jgi:rod shape-determining protein MreD
MGQRTAITILLVGAVLADAVLGALRPATVRPPLLVLAVVAGVALVGGVRVGMVTGFVAGLLLDVLSGPASLVGVHTLTGLFAGTVAGYERRQSRAWVWSPSAFASVIGTLVVASAAALSVMLHRLLGTTVTDMLDSVVAGVAAGAIVTPVAQRAQRWLAYRPLFERSPRA